MNNLSGLAILIGAALLLRRTRTNPYDPDDPNWTPMTEGELQAGRARWRETKPKDRDVRHGKLRSDATGRTVRNYVELPHDRDVSPGNLQRDNRPRHLFDPKERKGHGGHVGAGPKVERAKETESERLDRIDREEAAKDNALRAKWTPAMEHKAREYAESRFKSQTDRNQFVLGFQLGMTGERKPGYRHEINQPSWRSGAEFGRSGDAPPPIVAEPKVTKRRQNDFAGRRADMEKRRETVRRAMAPAPFGPSDDAIRRAYDARLAQARADGYTVVQPGKKPPEPIRDPNLLDGVRFTKPATYNGHKRSDVFFGDHHVRINEIQHGTYAVERPEAVYFNGHYVSDKWKPIDGGRYDLTLAKRIAAMELKGINPGQSQKLYYAPSFESFKATATAGRNPFRLPAWMRR